MVIIKISYLGNLVRSANFTRKAQTYVVEVVIVVVVGIGSKIFSICVSSVNLNIIENYLKVYLINNKKKILFIDG